MVNIVVGLVILGLLFLLLGAIVRFSVVSALRTRGAGDRLREPDLNGVERVCGFRPPADLVRAYIDGTFTGRTEFVLVDTTREPPKAWSFGSFYPLTGRDVAEQRRLHNISSGIPIADDLDKGVYFVTSDGKIMFRPPGRRESIMEVAPSAAAFARFELLDSE